MPFYNDPITSGIPCDLIRLKEPIIEILVTKSITISPILFSSAADFLIFDEVFIFMFSTI